jgi:hypothetical protein
MTFKFLPLFAAILACALWPQGVVLCLGDEGHVEVELEGTGCCPDETGDCADCVDLVAPDQQSAPVSVVIAPPSVRAIGLLPEVPSIAHRIDTFTPLLPPRESVLEGVVLLV